MKLYGLTAMASLVTSAERHPAEAGEKHISPPRYGRGGLLRRRMNVVERKSFPVDFDISRLKIRWSDRVLIKKGNHILGEGVVYGGNWDKAERLARQMAKMKFGATRGGLPVCEQVFIGKISDFRLQISDIRLRGSNLKVKVGRDVIQDIRVIKFIRQQLGFPNEIRIDANQGYSLKQLRYLIPTLKEGGIEYVEEPVEVKDLVAAYKILHRYGLKIILDESLNVINFIEFVKFIDIINIKLSRIGDIEKALQLIKLAKKHGIKVVIGCSEEMERGMKAIYALGHEAQRAGVLLEVEGFGPIRLSLAKLGINQGKPLRVPRLVNRLENLSIIISHRIRQLLFEIYWFVLRLGVLGMKKTKLLSSLSLHLVKLTGKSGQKIHPKHLIFQKHPPEFLKYLSPGDLLLDVGCGNGRHSLLAAGKVKEVIGFDVDKSQLKIAVAEARRRGINNVEFEYGSAEKKLPYRSNSFDKVLFFGVLEHLYSRKEVLSEVNRVLKRNGRLLLGVPNETTGWKKLQMRVGIHHFTDPDHKVEFTRESILELLTETGFVVKKILPTAYDTPWAGLIDVVGGISLQLYEKILRWKWEMAKKYPQDSISFLVIASYFNHLND